MKQTIRLMVAGVLAFGVLSAPVQAQGHSGKSKPAKTVQKSERKTTKTYNKGTRRYNRTTSYYRSRVLCEDGTWVTRGLSACADRGGLAARQAYPPASARARERASANSRVVRGFSNTTRTGAIARCSDGTFWHSSTRTDACYRHGGVAYWL